MERARISDTRVAAGLALLVLAALALATARSATPPDAVHFLPCPARLLTGHPCPGCGMTRASVALLRGDLAGAWRLHPFALLLVPVAAANALAPGATRKAWAALPPALRRGLGALLLLGAFGLWLIRAS